MDYDSSRHQSNAEFLADNLFPHASLRQQRSYHTHESSHQTMLILAVVAVLYLQGDSVAAMTRIDEDIRIQDATGSSCISYDDNTGVFTLTCSFAWGDATYPEDGYVLLKAHEVFDGNDLEIDLDGLDNFEGMFQICDESVSSLQDAPVIKHLHVRNGQTSTVGGFIVQQNQNNFIVESYRCFACEPGEFAPAPGEPE